MIYVVSANRSLFTDSSYSNISLTEAVNIINSWDIVQFDTETSGRNPHIATLLCAQFGNKKCDTQIVVDCSGNNNILAFKEILENKLIVGQNLKFDLQFLYNYAIIPTKIYDTMIAEQVLYLGYPVYGKPGGISYSLKALGERYLNIDIDKSTRGEIIWRGLDAKVISYAAGDVMYLEDIKEAQEKEILRKDCLKAVLLENKFVPVCAYLEWCGIKLDKQKWKQKMDSDAANLNKAVTALNAFVEKSAKKGSSFGEIYSEEKFLWCVKDSNGRQDFEPPKDAKIIQESVTEEHCNDGSTKYYVTIRRPYPFCTINYQGDLFTGFDTNPHCSINWSSSRQVIPYVKFLGFNTSVQDKKTGEDKDSVLEKVLSTQKGINDEFLNLYFKYQEYSKLVSSFGQGHLNAINPKTGRIHTTYKQLGASSGRMSCGSSQSDSDLANYKKLKPSECKYPNFKVGQPHNG